MPRYLYECQECGEQETVFHRIDDMHLHCSVCDMQYCMRKLFTNSFAIKRKQTRSNKNEKVGSITQEYIEKNREILKTEQEEAKKETYEPS